MKNKIIVFAIAISLYSMSSFAQILSNTTWYVFDTSYNYSLYYHFDTDTISYSNNNISYINLATYSENGNYFEMIALPAAPCMNDTGTYNFSIQNDTLNFTLIYDDCPTRDTVFTLFNWVRVPTDISTITYTNTVKIFPNPVGNILNISRPLYSQESLYYIKDITGRIVSMGNINGELSAIDFSTFKSGLYFIFLESNSRHPIKVLKE